MTDRITANLPSRSFDTTEAFYARLGFEREYRDDGWMILTRGPLEVEFFSHPEIDPKTSWFSACMRVDDLDALHSEWLALDELRITTETVRFRPELPRMFFMHDPDGSLWRVIENRRS